MNGSPPPESSRRERLLVLLAYVALGLLQCAGALRGWHLLGANDWNYFLGQTEADVVSLRSWGQFPLWSPWKHGGQPQFGQPEAMLLTPVTPLALLLGTLSAYKLLLVPTLVAGAWGCRALAGHLGLRGAARAVPGLVFFGCSTYPLYLSAGLPNWLFALALLPWTVLAALRAAEDLRAVLRLGALLAGVLYCGGLYPFTWLPIVLGCVALADALARRSPRPLLALAAGGVVAAALAAPRLAPLFEIYGLFPRVTAGEDGFLVPSLIARAWLGTELPDLTTPRGPVVFTGETAVYWSYVGAYVGPLGVALAAAGALLAWRRAWPWLLLGGVFAWLSLGGWARPSLWDALRELPFYSSMRAPNRLLVFATFALALLAGLGWEALAARARRLWPGASPAARRLAAVAALAALLLPMLAVNGDIASAAFTVEPTPGLVAGEFHQGPPAFRERQWGGECFEAVRANVGNPLGMSDIPTPPAVASRGAPDYRGEAWLLDGHGTLQAEITPNALRLVAEVDAPDTLVVNQNWFPGWRAHGTLHGELVPLSAERNLLSLPLPAGRHALRLEYRPSAVTRGLILGGLAALVAALHGWRRRAAAVQRAGAPEGLALLAFAALAAGIGLPRLPEAPAPRPGTEDRWLAQAVRLSPGPDAQAVLDAAPPAALVLLEPGRHAALTLTRGLALMAAPGAPARLDGPLLVRDLPPGERVALVGAEGRSLHLAGGLQVEGAGGVLLQSARVDGAVAVAAGAELHLIDCELTGPLALHGARAHALRSRLAGATLRDGAALVLARTPPPSTDADASSSMHAEDPDLPQVSLLESRFQQRSAVIEVRGAPGQRGWLLLSTAPALLAAPPLDGWLLADPAPPAIPVELVLDASGRARRTLRLPERIQRPGWGLFAQFAWVADGRLALARADGHAFALREAPPGAP